MKIPEYKSLFIHIPKAAGQSIENFILHSLGKNREFDGKNYLLKPNEDPLNGSKRLAHLTTQEYLKYQYVTEEEFNSFYKFTLVRNPWTRLISFYKYMGYSSLISFNTFVTCYLPICFEENYWFFRPQADFIYNEKDELIVDFVGRLETINNDFSVIADKLNINFDQLPKSNYSVDKKVFSRKTLQLIFKHPKIIKDINFQTQNLKDCKIAYNQSSLDVVNKLYARDIDLLKYKF